MQDSKLLCLSAEIVSAYVAHNGVPAGVLPDLIRTVYASLNNIESPLPEVVARAPAVSIRKSIFPGYIVCLEDGKKLKMLKRHLQTSYGMSPDQYRAKWGLPDSYPMVAPEYAARRSALAKEIGLGRIAVSSAPIEVPPSTVEPSMLEVPVQKIPERKRGRPSGSKSVQIIETEAVVE